MQSFGGILDFGPNDVVDLICLDAIDPRYRITLDQARWHLIEGQLVLSLWENADRIYSLSFCFASEQGKLIAYIGGIQGFRHANSLERYRQFAFLAAGMRPRDFLIEVFKTLCRTLNITQILAVSDSNHVGRGGFWGKSNSKVVLSYDQVWSERGGIDNGNGFFKLPIGASRRVANQVVLRKKRKLYRRRYPMLDKIDFEIAHALRSSCNLSSVRIQTVGELLSNYDRFGGAEPVRR